jgi:hypothetical protein
LVALKEMITTLDVEALKLLGIPAVQQTNVIRLPNTWITKISGFPSAFSAFSVAKLQTDF